MRRPFSHTAVIGEASHCSDDGDQDEDEGEGEDEPHHRQRLRSMMEPLVEMSQDCVVEWNESQTSISPPPPGSSTTKKPSTSKSASSSSSSSSSSSNSKRGGPSSIGLESVRRSLEAQQQQQQQQKGGTTSSTLTLTRARSRQPEDEIDAIFQMLAQEDETQTSATDISTQRRSNRTSPRDKIARRAAGTHRPSSSLASRRRRRQRDATSRGSNKRSQLEPPPPPPAPGHISRLATSAASSALAKHPSTATATEAPSHTSPMPTSSENGTDPSEGAFDRLLKHLSTPQPPTESSPKVPAKQSGTREKENSNPQPSAAGTAATKTNRQPLRPQPLPQPPPVQPSSIAIAATDRIMKETTREPPPNPARPPLHPSVPQQASIPASSGRDTTAPAPRPPSKDTLPAVHSSINATMPPPQPTKPAGTGTNLGENTFIFNSVTSKSTNNTNTNDNKDGGDDDDDNDDDDDDEFGDFDLGDIDMECLDSLLSAKSSQHAMNLQATSVSSSTSHTTTSKGSNPPHPLATTRSYTTHVSMPHQSTKLQPSHLPQPVNVQSLSQPRPDTQGSCSTASTGPAGPAIPETAVQPLEIKSSKQQQQQQVIIEDEFGEFPDFDFDIIDQAIAERQLTQQDTEPPQSDALSNELVRNHTSEYANSDPSGLSFIKFSRYKVLSIHDDTQLFCKTLTVAKWTEEMLRDETEETKIHRNCRVEVVPATTTAPEGRVVTHQLSARRNVEYPECGRIQLRGQWYYTMLSPGDVVHVCSLAGRYRTDATALPIVLHSHPPEGSDTDDLVLIHHPDMLMTPTVVSETVTCPRRAVFKSRNGSSGLTSQAALIGTLRHELFGLCMKEKNFEGAFVIRNAKKIVRENAEGLLGCGATTAEAEQQIVDTLPVLIDFVNEHTTFGPSTTTNRTNFLSGMPASYVNGHIGVDKGVRFVAHSTYSVEEPVISPELALKGFVDAVVETTTSYAASNENLRRSQHTIDGQKHSLMALELKTGHNQTSQHTHMGQLSLYTLMLQGRYGMQLERNQLRSTHSTTGSRKPDPEGAAPGGLLLYLNQKSSKATHVAPEFHEFKTLIAQRNVIAGEVAKVSRPRGVTLSYEEEKGNGVAMEDAGANVKLFPAPPALLPDVQPSVHSCTRCFENRTCMLYAASEIEHDDWGGVKKTHGELLSKFTGQLVREDLEYFRKWDRLIDLEAHASFGNISQAWLVDSHKREKETGESISALCYDGAQPGKEGSGVLLRFRRGRGALSQETLETLSIAKGCQVVVSTDGSSFADSQSDPTLEYENTQRQTKKFRHHMNVIRGYLASVSGDGLLISAKRDDLDRIRDMVRRYKKMSEDDGSAELMFRVDKDSSAVGVGTLRQNLINLFTADYARSDKEEPSQLDIAKQRRLPRLRDFIVRLQSPSFAPVKDQTSFQSIGATLPGCDSSHLSQDFNDLNPDQRTAVEKVLNSEDYTLIQGLPGTGKTSTLSFIARLLAARGKRVLITSYTNSAVDNVVLKLMEKGVGSFDQEGICSLVRVGPRHSCHEAVRPLHAHDIAVNMEKLALGQSKDELSQGSVHQSRQPSAEFLRRVMSSARIVCSTVLTVPRSPLLVNEQFDVVIVDEAGQTSQPAILGALMAADSFVLVGDHKQLPPLVSSEIAQAGGYGESMLMRLAEKHPNSVAALTLQYRMNDEICKLSSYLIYGGRLKCGNDEVFQQRLQLPGYPEGLPPTSNMRLWPWLKMTIDPQKPVIFVDTDNIRKTPQCNSSQKSEMEALEEKMGGRAGGNVTNPTEATLVRYIVEGLISSGVPAESIGVISPFRAQVRILDDDQTISKWKKIGLEVSTIDRYQGRDKPVIILSFVRSNPVGKVGRLLHDKRRLNVALTRAKSKLIILGSFSTLKNGSAPLRPMLGRINSNEQRQLLPDNAIECYHIP